jgi:putative nucleotidyltransferase with HDIG domain
MVKFFESKTRRGNGRRGGRRKSVDEDEDELEGKAYSFGPLLRHRLRLAGLTLLFATAVVLICFVGQAPPTVGTLGEVAPENVYSDRNFKYSSGFLRQELEAWTRTSTPLEYSRDFAGEEDFAKSLILLKDRLVANMGKAGESLNLARDALQEELMVTFRLELSPEEMRVLGLIRSEDSLGSLFDEMTETLGHLHATGVLVDPSSDQKFLSEANATLAISRRMSETANNLAVIGGVDAGLELLFDIASVRIRFPHVAHFISEVRTRIEDDGPFPADGLALGDIVAMPDANSSVEALQLRAELSAAFSTIARQGLFLRTVDRSKTIQAQERKIGAIQTDKYEVSVSEGDVILRKGDEVTEDAMEKYKRFIDLSADERGLLARRILLTCTTFLCSLLYISLVLPNFWRSGAKTGIVATAVLGNLLLSRGVIELGGTDLFGGNPLLVGMLPYLLPVAFSSMVVMITVGPKMGAVAALMTSTFHAAMQDTGVESLVISLGASLMGAFFCRDVRLRGSALKAGTMAGLVAAVFAIAIGLIAGSTLTSIFNHGVAALLTGLVTGGLVLGALPVFERIFKVATDVTLFELTDYNHPLLRRMQVEAPGSYHHSLMVANLAENAAAAVGASPLLCRACSLFHDIGKMKQPEYFTENQTALANPHSRRNPAMSALIIKSHVKEGVEMAREHGLPKVVRDVIRQHHGTTLVKYFYHEAKKQVRQERLPLGEGADLDEPDESTYRYDGPKPRFRESAIIFFADSVEAAARSLRKVTTHSVEELLEAIFVDRLEDGQLDECPLTLEEIAAIKSSFISTILNMLHSRIEYPEDEKPKKRNGARERRNVKKNSEQGEENDGQSNSA